MCNGGIVESLSVGDTSRTIENYFVAAELKTASALRLAGILGAELSGVDPAVAEAAGVFGRHFGLAWQIWDDLLDLTADSRLSGKPENSDLRNSIFTLPVIIAMNASGKIRGVINDMDLRRDNLTPLIHMIRDSGAFSEATAIARDHVRRAEKALQLLPQPVPLHELMLKVERLHLQWIEMDTDGCPGKRQPRREAPMKAVVPGCAVVPGPRGSQGTLRSNASTIEPPKNPDDFRSASEAHSCLVSVLKRELDLLPEPFVTSLDEALSSEGLLSVAGVFLAAASIGVEALDDKLFSSALALQLPVIAGQKFVSVRDELIAEAAVEEDSLSILLADYTIALALLLAGKAADPSRSELASFVRTALTGASLDLKDRWNFRRQAAQYFECADAREATIFALAAKLGARRAAADGPTTELWVAFAASVGCAVRVLNDVRDIVLHRGIRVRRGDPTLPVIYAVEERSDLLRELDRLRSGSDFDWDWHAVRETNALKRCGAEIRRQANNAQALLRDANAGSRAAYAFAQAVVDQAEWLIAPE